MDAVRYLKENIFFELKSLSKSKKKIKSAWEYTNWHIGEPNDDGVGGCC